MNFQIKSIILWPKNPELNIRIIPFDLNKVNVITGSSRTGKSALIPIIDYCLASNYCKIPVNVIRNACSWFGVIIETSNGDCLFARREPGDLKSTDDMFVQEGEAINITNIAPTKNTTAEQVRLQLGELAGLSKLDFSGYSDWGFNARISFKDLSAFIFQPQNIIANPDVLFYKTDTQEHRQKLRTIFPYILGAITSEILLKQHQLKQLETLLQKKERELNNIQEVSARWLGELKSHIIRAQEFGLLQNDNINELSKNEMVDLLNDIVKNQNKERKIKPPSIKESINKLDEIEKLELDLSTKLTSLRRRMQEIKRLESTTEDFFNAQTKQINRLKISSWFSDSFKLNGTCPICHNTLESEQSTLNSLIDSLKEIENNADFRKEVPMTLDLEKSRIISEIEKYTESLEGIRIQKDNLIESSQSIKNGQYKIEKIQRFIGNIENALILYKQLGVNEKLNSEVKELKYQVAELQKIVDRRLIRKKTDSALDSVSQIASEILPMLDVEFPDSPIKLNDIDLTVQVIRDGGYDNLWQIGSGSNWLAYHIAVMLSLQIFFKKMVNSPVPGLLIFDQPSQVYFPSNISKDNDDPKLTNEDMLAVKKVFMTMKLAIEKSSNNLQILIFDHASEEVWNGIEGIHLVEEWRNGLKLIPEEWLQV